MRKKTENNRNVSTVNLKCSKLEANDTTIESLNIKNAEIDNAIIQNLEVQNSSIFPSGSFTVNFSMNGGSSTPASIPINFTYSIMGEYVFLNIKNNVSFNVISGTDLVGYIPTSIAPSNPLFIQSSIYGTTNGTDGSIGVRIASNGFMDFYPLTSSTIFYPTTICYKLTY